MNKKFSKTVVVFSILTILSFTISVLFLSWMMIPVPDSLIYAFFGFFGAEMLALAGIRGKEISYIRREERDEREERQYYG